MFSGDFFTFSELKQKFPGFLPKNLGEVVKTAFYLSIDFFEVLIFFGKFSVAILDIEQKICGPLSRKVRQVC